MAEAWEDTLLEVGVGSYDLHDLANISFCDILKPSVVEAFLYGLLEIFGFGAEIRVDFHVLDCTGHNLHLEERGLALGHLGLVQSSD